MDQSLFDSAQIGIDLPADLSLLDWRLDSAAFMNDESGLMRSREMVQSPNGNSSDDSTTEHDFDSPSPSSPSSETRGWNDIDQMAILDQAVDQTLVEDTSYGEFKDSAPEESIPHDMSHDEVYADSDPSSYDDDYDDSMIDDSLSTTESQVEEKKVTGNAVSAAAQPKRRGRPSRPKASPTPTTTNTKKRKADSISATNLMGTKKVKTGAAGLALVDRLPSTISAAELQSLSSSEYDAYMKALEGKVSKNEWEIARQQRRRIKNRESASNSRVRKQENVTDLQAQVLQLKQENEQLKSRVRDGQIQSECLRNQLLHLKEYSRKHFPAELLPPFFEENSNLHAPAHDEITETHLSKLSNKQARPLFGRDVRASASLMCLLLFALAWGCYNSSLLVPGSVLKQADIPMHTATNFLAPVTSSQSFNGLSNTIPASKTWLVNMVRQAEMNKAASASASSSATATQPTSVIGSVEMPVTHAPRTETDIVSTMDTSTNDTIISATLDAPGSARYSTSSSTSTSTASSNSASSAPTAVVNPVTWKQNTTYMMCDGMKQVVPPQGAQPAVDPKAPLFISLWVQPTAISTSSIPAASKDPLHLDYMVQVTCQIVSVDQLGLLTNALPSSSASLVE